MIKYSKKELKNGLEVVFHHSEGDIVCVNIAYRVGSKNEDPKKTGLAHFTEHMMFCDSINIKDYDSHLQRIGGVNNAYTNHDFTNYYALLPKENIETILWLESDRMLGMGFSKKSLDVQKKLVIEEFKETQSNKPYGNLYPAMLDLAYKKHPYRWSVIGKEEEHIEGFTCEDVKNFFGKYYNPKNASLVISGNFEEKFVFDLAEKWFGEIESKNLIKTIEPEPKQNEYRVTEISGEAPFDAVYMGYKMSPRLSKDFYAFEILEGILSDGKSSLLYKKLVDEERIFNSVDSFLSEFQDEGLFILGGSLNPSFSPQEGEKKILEVIDDFISQGLKDNDLEKVKNNYETSDIFNLCSLSNRTERIAEFCALGDLSLINLESNYISMVSKKKILDTARETFIKNNCSTVYFKKN